MARFFYCIIRPEYFDGVLVKKCAIARWDFDVRLEFFSVFVKFPL